MADSVMVGVEEAEALLKTGETTEEPAEEAAEYGTRVVEIGTELVLTTVELAGLLRS